MTREEAVLEVLTRGAANLRRLVERARPEPFSHDPGSVNFVRAVYNTTRVLVGRGLVTRDPDAPDATYSVVRQNR